MKRISGFESAVALAIGMTAFAQDTAKDGKETGAAVKKAVNSAKKVMEKTKSNPSS